jgi:hypothetical protein
MPADLTLQALMAPEDLGLAYERLCANLIRASPLVAQEFVISTPGGHGWGAWWFAEHQLWAHLEVEAGGYRYWCGFGIHSPLRAAQASAHL